MTTGGDDSVGVAWKDGSIAEGIGKPEVGMTALVMGSMGTAVLVASTLKTGAEGKLVCGKKVGDAETGAEDVASAMEEVANGDDGLPSVLSVDASPSYTFSEFTAQYESLNASGLFCTKSWQLEALGEHVPS